MIWPAISWPDDVEATGTVVIITEADITVVVWNVDVVVTAVVGGVDVCTFVVIVVEG